MPVPVSKRTLLQSMLAGAVLLLSASACSRSDRAETGSDTTASTVQDTSLPGSGQSGAGSPEAATGTDTMRSPGENAGTGAAPGDTAPARLQSDVPRAATASPSNERRDTSAAEAGNRAMEQDTITAESDSARVTEDTSETSLNPAPDSALGYVEMARDTTSGTDQIDTSRVAVADPAAAGDTTMNAGRVRPVEDSTEILGQVTTGTSDVTVAAADSADAAGEGAIAARGADTTGNAGRIRPPEDSTEIQGDANAAETANVNTADTADEAPVVADAAEVELADRETQVAADTQAVAAAAVDGTVTGGDAVALTTRQGEQCSLVDPEANAEARWDMSSTPATLNPCGLGSMNLSKVGTAGQR